MLLISSDQFVFTIAILSLLLYLFKLASLFFGGDSGSLEGADASDVFDADFHNAETEANFSVFSLQSILAFFMGSSWSLLAFRHSFYWSEPSAWFGAIAFGFAMMILSAYLLSRMHRLSSESHFDIEKAKGQTGQTYLPIPPRGEGFGQVELVVDGRKRIFKACSEEDQTIKAFTRVTVTKVDNRSLVVRKD